jgi:hypothetical protein
MTLPLDVTRLGTELLDHQLWSWGLDVGHDGGNLLVRYGFTRLRAPSRDEGSSCYRLSLPSGRHLTLWGFGVLWGEEGHGGVFLRRHTFAPRITPLVVPTEPLWRLDQLPALRLARACEDSERVARAIGELAHWIAAYEEWIVSALGVAWRVDGTFKRPRRVRRRLTVRPEQYPLAWRGLGERCGVPHRE